MFQWPPKCSDFLFVLLNSVSFLLKSSTKWSSKSSSCNGLIFICIDTLLFLLITGNFHQLIPVFYSKLMKQTYWMTPLPRQGLKIPPCSLTGFFSAQHVVPSLLCAGISYYSPLSPIWQLLSWYNTKYFSTDQEYSNCLPRKVLGVTSPGGI